MRGQLAGWPRGRLLGRPLLADRFNPLAATVVDARLLVGAALFGAGWGIGGICPGPGVVTLTSGTNTRVIAFVAAMCGGMFVDKVAREQPSVGALDGCKAQRAATAAAAAVVRIEVGPRRPSKQDGSDS